MMFLTLFPPYPHSDGGRMCETVPTPPKAAANRSRAQPQAGTWYNSVKAGLGIMRPLKQLLHWLNLCVTELPLYLDCCHDLPRGAGTAHLPVIHRKRMHWSFW